MNLTPLMTSVLAKIGDRSLTAHEMGVNGCVFKRLTELGLLQIDLPREGFHPPVYSLSEKGRGAAAVLNAAMELKPTVGPVAHIQQAVANHYRIPLIEMVSERRARAVSRPRQVAMYLAKETTPKSLPDIGRRFGGRDHTTVIHAIKTVKTLMAENPAFFHEVSTLKSEILSAKEAA